MRCPPLGALLLIATALPGCGGSSPSPLKAGGPHQGTSIELPKGRGFAELVIEPLAKPAARSAPTEVVLYFLGPDKATPLSPPPSGVVLEIVDPESRQKKERKLEPRPKPGDPAGAGRFASGPIDQDYSNFALVGTLRLDLGDGEASIPF